MRHYSYKTLVKNNTTAQRAHSIGETIILWKAVYSMHQCKYSLSIVLRQGDTSSWDFPRLARIIASSIQDVWDLIGDVLSWLPRLFMADKLGLHVGFMCYLASLSPWKSPVIWYCTADLSIKPKSSIVCIFSQCFFPWQVGLSCDLFRWIYQILGSSQPRTASALAMHLVTPLTLCFQISSLPTAQIIMVPLGKAVCSWSSRVIIRGGVSVLKKIPKW